MKKYGLGIESTCDETGIALIEFDSESCLLKQNALYSQIVNHEKYGGIVPEIASRKHLAKIHYLLEEVAQSMGGIESLKKKLAFIAVASNPGLLGSLLIGNQVAASLASIWNIPLISVNHLEAHLNIFLFDTDANFQQIKFPALGVLLSGGNSVLFNYKNINDMDIIGQTMDDALGEALDKAAKMLDIGYPGGPVIEKFANQFDINNSDFKNPFPKLLAKQNKSEYNFSYSGIKTCLVNYLKSYGMPKNDTEISAICYYFQKSCFEIVARNTINAQNSFKFKSILFGGGVMANQTLKNEIRKVITGKLSSVPAYLPTAPKWCTDNGAMIAAMGLQQFRHNLKLANIPPQLSTQI